MVIGVSGFVRAAWGSVLIHGDVCWHMVMSRGGNGQSGSREIVIEDGRYGCWVVALDKQGRTIVIYSLEGWSRNIMSFCLSKYKNSSHYYTLSCLLSLYVAIARIAKYFIINGRGSFRLHKELFDKTGLALT